MDNVWSTVKDFNALNSASGRGKDEIVEGKNTPSGPGGLLTLKGAELIKERLLATTPTAALRLFHRRRGHTGEQLQVELHRQVHRRQSILGHLVGPLRVGRTGDNPADNENDKTAKDAINGVYQSGLTT